VNEHLIESSNQLVFSKILTEFQRINMLEWNGKKRKICVFINPISGQRKSISIVKNKLIPKLEFIGHDYKIYTTDHAEFMDEFFENLNPSDFPFTDVVICGGDGFVF